MSGKRGRKAISGPRELFEHVSPSADGSDEQTICKLCNAVLPPLDWTRVGNLRRHLDVCKAATHGQKAQFGSPAASSNSKRRLSPKGAKGSPQSGEDTAQKRLNFEPYKAYTAKDEFTANCLQAKWKAAANIHYHAFNHPLFADMIKAYSRGASQGASGDALRRTYIPKVYNGEAVVFITTILV